MVGQSWTPERIASARKWCERGGSRGRELAAAIDEIERMARETDAIEKIHRADKYNLSQEITKLEIGRTGLSRIGERLQDENAALRRAAKRVIDSDEGRISGVPIQTALRWLKEALKPASAEGGGG